MATFDGNGLIIDRLDDVRTQINNDLKDAFGDGLNLAETSPFGVIVGVMSERYAALYELLEAVYLASFPNTAFGIYLDEAVAYNGVVREKATYSTVTLQFTRVGLDTTNEVPIPAGTQVSAAEGSSTVWSTTAAAVIEIGNLTTSTQAQPGELGEVGALAGTLTRLVAAVANISSVVNPADAVEGQEEETDSELKIRRIEQLGRSGTSTEQGIRSALTLLDELRNATVAVNDTDITDGEGRPPHSVEAFGAVASGFNFGQISQIVYSEAFVVSNSIEIFIDAGSIGSVPFNTDQETTLDDINALLIADSRIAASTNDTVLTVGIQGSTSASLVISTSVTGGASQATGVWSALAEAGDTLDIVAQTIWDSKAAGIQTVGDFAGVALDTSGDSHIMYFSEILDVRIWVRLTLTVDGTYDAPTAETAMAQALETYSVLNLTAGVDVLNYKLLCAASDVGSAGVLDIVSETSLDGISYAPINRVIDVSQFADISAADVSFVYV